MVIWVTGISGAGKTTFAKHLYGILKLQLKQVVHLDGDELRQDLQFTGSQCYDRESRLKLGLTYAKLANTLSNQNLIVILSTISLFKEIHAWNRKNIKEYLEILLDPPIEIICARDPKGLYSKFKKFSKTNIAGLDLDVDFPIKPEFQFSHFSHKDINTVADKALEITKE